MYGRKNEQPEGWSGSARVTVLTLVRDVRRGSREEMVVRGRVWQQMQEERRHIIDKALQARAVMVSKRLLHAVLRF